MKIHVPSVNRRRPAESVRQGRGRVPSKKNVSCKEYMNHRFKGGFLKRLVWPPYPPIWYQRLVVAIVVPGVRGRWRTSREFRPRGRVRTNQQSLAQNVTKMVKYICGILDGYKVLGAVDFPDDSTKVVTQFQQVDQGYQSSPNARRTNQPSSRKLLVDTPHPLDKGFPIEMTHCIGVAFHPAKS